MNQTSIEEKPYMKKFEQKIEKTLILEMTDGTQIRIDDQYAYCWNDLQDAKNIGKEVKYYSKNTTGRYVTPVQLEVDGKIIYRFQKNVVVSCLLVAFTLMMLHSSVTELSAYFKPKSEVK
jgi:hypothetical protein